MLKLLLIACVAGEADPSGANEVDMRCGAYCLYVSLKALDLPVQSYADVEAKLGAPSATGYSLGQLADVASGYGAATLGVVTTPERLLRRSRPFACIARIGDDHFVNIGGVQKDAAMIVDAPRNYELPLDTLRRQWDGTALLLSTSPLAPEEALRGRNWTSVVATGVLGLVLFAGVLAWFRHFRRRLS
ncbi:MAG: cysteine peptidase family C39 domain-containing protein [Pirellulales bacterium]